MHWQLYNTQPLASCRRTPAPPVSNCQRRGVKAYVDAGVVLTLTQMIPEQCQGNPPSQAASIFIRPSDNRRIRTSKAGAADAQHSPVVCALCGELQYAQFEREIISERARDKMGAARRKGKWVGGNPVLGYDVALQDGEWKRACPIHFPDTTGSFATVKRFKLTVT